MTLEYYFNNPDCKITNHNMAELIDELSTKRIIVFEKHYNEIIRLLSIIPYDMFVSYITHLIDSDFNKKTDLYKSYIGKIITKDELKMYLYQNEFLKKMLNDIIISDRVDTYQQLWSHKQWI